MNKKIHILYLITLCSTINMPLEAADWRDWLTNIYQRHYGSRSTVFKILAPITAVGLCAAAYYKYTTNQQLANKLRPEQNKAIQSEQPTIQKKELTTNETIEQQNTLQRMLADQNNQLTQLFEQNSAELNSALTYIEVLLQVPLDLVIPKNILDQYNNNLPDIFAHYNVTTATKWNTDTSSYALERIKNRNNDSYIKVLEYNNKPFLSIDNIPRILSQAKEMIKACLPENSLELINKKKEYNLTEQYGGINKIMTYIILKKFISKNNLSNISIPFHFFIIKENGIPIKSHQEATNIINKHINIMVDSPFTGLRCSSPNLMGYALPDPLRKYYATFIVTDHIEKQPNNGPNEQTKKQLAKLATIFEVNNKNTVYDKNGNATIIDIRNDYLQSLTNKSKELVQQQKRITKEKHE